MIYKYNDENEFYSSFLDIIIHCQCGRHYDPNNHQHVSWLKNKIHTVYLMGGKALCAYTDGGIPIGFLFYQHDKGLDGIRCFGKKAQIIMFELYEKYQSKGIGTSMLGKVCEDIKKNGAQCLYTDTYLPNKGAICFYIKNDFIPVAVHQGENGIDDDGQLYLYKVL